MENNEAVRKHYDENPRHEWERMTRHPFEFEINMRFLKRYLRPGQCVLDVGGGPGALQSRFGRAGLRCNARRSFAGKCAFCKGESAGIGLAVACFRRRRAQPLPASQARHLTMCLCMGPLYHLLDESDRTSRSGGMSFTSALRRHVRRSIYYTGKRYHLYGT